jgi:hypothetical protein
MQYQVLESKQRSNTLQIKRFYVTTIDNETGVERSHDQLYSHTDEHLYICTEVPPDMNSSNLYMYSIASKNANTNVSIIFLKQNLFIW